jgi:hypothetical protein
LTFYLYIKFPKQIGDSNFLSFNSVAFYDLKSIIHVLSSRILPLDPPRINICPLSFYSYVHENPAKDGESLSSIYNHLSNFGSYFSIFGFDKIGI